MLQLTTIRNSQVLNRELKRNEPIFLNSRLKLSCTTSIASADEPEMRYAME